MDSLPDCRERMPLQTASTRLAVILNSRLVGTHDDVVHPVFRKVMAHAADPTTYIQRAEDDPNPLTDLRVRLDPAPREMLRRNVAAIIEVDPTFRGELFDIRPRDFTVSQLCNAILGESTPPDTPMSESSGSEGSDRFSEMHRLVNAFGSWEDAARVANQVNAKQREGIALPPRELGTAALVLALQRMAGYDELFKAALEIEASPTELFFYGLRWASIEAKRNHDLVKATSVLDDTMRRYAQLPTPSEGDGATVAGMAGNFRGLIALRSKDITAAEDLAAAATADLVDGWKASTALGQPEKARYVWMALLNRAQLAWFKGEIAVALGRFEEALQFSREFDADAVHSSLSVLAYSHLQNDDPASALPLAREAVSLVRNEYDPGLVLQVRKVLLRAYLELGMTAEATRLQPGSKYFWRDEEM